MEINLKNFDLQNIDDFNNFDDNINNFDFSKSKLIGCKVDDGITDITKYLTLLQYIYRRMNIINKNQNLSIYFVF